MIVKSEGKNICKTDAAAKPVPEVQAQPNSLNDANGANNTHHASNAEGASCGNLISTSTGPGVFIPPLNKTKKKLANADVKNLKVDKKGIPILTDNDDLEELFQFNRKKDKILKEDFGQLFEDSQLDLFHRVMLLEKKENSDELKSPSVTERLKDYPFPQEELDLHGFNAVKAEKRTEFFIRNVRHMGIKTVRIIVGKGIHSDGKPVLPDVVESKIIELKHKEWVFQYRWDNKNKNKSGSMIVYLVPKLN